MASLQLRFAGQSLMFLGDRGPAIYNLHLARGATLILIGSEDDVVAMPQMGSPFFEELRKRTFALHGSDKDIFDFIFIPGGGHRPYFLTRSAALWLQQKLHFPNWTAASIANMPETHIMEWAAKNHVVIEKLYATELREGGTHALGTDIPAVPHDDLNALRLERWQLERDQYVYETWLKNAKARLTP